MIARLSRTRHTATCLLLDGRRAAPAPSVFVVAIGALLFANLVAILPGRVAARTPSAVLLRTE